MDNSTLVSTSLLKDALRFIDETLSKEVLSLLASTQRRDLVTKLTPLVHKNSGDRYASSYLDMTVGANKVKPVLPSEDLEEYIDVDEHSEIIEEEYEECPAEFEAVKLERSVAQLQNQISTEDIDEKTDKIIISAVDLKDIALKVGPLFRKERIFFIEQMRRCWAAVHESCMYFYSSEKDSKPTLVVDLAGYHARPMPIPAKDCKKRDAIFELVAPGKKTIQLVARTAKDMHQWVAIICKSACYTDNTAVNNSTKVKTARRELPSIPDSDEETYDDINIANHGTLSPSVEEDEEEIYHVPSEIHVPGDVSDEEDLYDDIGQIYPNSVYYNVSKDKDAQNVKKNMEISKDNQHNSKMEEKKKEEEFEEEEDFYDDISAYQISDPPLQNEPVVIPQKSLPVEKGMKSKTAVIDVKSKPHLLGTKPFLTGMKPVLYLLKDKDAQNGKKNVEISKDNHHNSKMEEKKKEEEVEEEEDFYDDISANQISDPPLQNEPVVIPLKSLPVEKGMKSKTAVIDVKSKPHLLGTKPVLTGMKPVSVQKGMKFQTAARNTKSQSATVGTKLQSVAATPKSQPQAKKIQDLILKMETSLKWNNSDDDKQSSS